MKTLAQMCRDIRIELNISQSKLAERVNSNQTEMSFIERGFIPCWGVEKKIRLLHKEVIGKYFEE